MQSSPIGGLTEVGQASLTQYNKPANREKTGKSSFMDAMKSEQKTESKPRKAQGKKTDAPSPDEMAALSKPDTQQVQTVDAVEDTAGVAELVAPVIVDAAVQPAPDPVNLMELINLNGDDAAQDIVVSLQHLLNGAVELTPEECASLNERFAAILAQMKEGLPPESALKDMGSAVKEALPEDKQGHVIDALGAFAAEPVAPKHEAGAATEDMMNMLADHSGAVLAGQLQQTGQAAPPDAQFTIPPESPVGRDVAAQFVQNVTTTVRDGLTECEIQLRPEFLGKMSVTLALNEGGALTAKIRTEDMAVRGLLQGQIETLKAQLEEQGVRVQDMEVIYQSVNYDYNQNDGTAGQAFEQQARHAPRIDIGNDEDGAAAYDTYAQTAVTQAAALGATVEFKG